MSLDFFPPLNAALNATTTVLLVTAYNLILGGWHNRISTLARMHEHGDDRQTRSDTRVDANRHYHFTVTRAGS